jgi:formylmethanofuran--tetrahydromethanopterin N-formyltransferase
VGRVETSLVDGATCCLEIVIDGVDETAVATAMEAGIRAAVGPEIVAVSAGNYGGKLGKFHFHLHQILSAS